MVKIMQAMVLESFLPSLICQLLVLTQGFPGGSVVKNLPANAGDEIFILGSGRSTGVDKGNPLQYFCLENLLSSEPWQATVHGDAKSQTEWLSMPTCIFISTSLILIFFYYLSAQFSHLVMSNSLLPHGLQHARPPCPSPTPGVYSNSCPLSPWCHPTISLSVIPFSSCLQSFPGSRYFSNESVLDIRWPKDWSFSFSISPSNEHPGLISFRMDWLDFLAVQGTLKSLLQHQ